MNQIRVKPSGRHGLRVLADGIGLYFKHDDQLYKVCRINRAKEALREALMQQGVLKAKTIDALLRDPRWAEQYINVYDNCESIRECEMLIAENIAEEIVEQIQKSAKK